MVIIYTLFVILAVIVQATIHHISCSHIVIAGAVYGVGLLVIYYFTAKL